MDMQVTITTFATTSVSDFLGLEAMAPGAQFVSQGGSFAAGGKAFSFIVTGSTWDRLRPYLVALSLQRIPAVDPTTGIPTNTGHTMPMLSYVVEPVPGDRPRVHKLQVVGENPAAISVGAGGPTVVKLIGQSLLAGLAASVLVTQTNPVTAVGYPGLTVPTVPVPVLQYTAVRKGPGANGATVPGFSAGSGTLNVSPVGGIVVNHLASAASASVITQIGADGKVVINVVPLNGAYTSTAIAAQVNGDALASLYVTATALVSSAALSPTSGLALAGGDGGGVALLDLPCIGFTGLAGGSGFLRVEALMAGAPQNMITLTLNVSQGANSVVVTGNDIVVNRTEAAPTATNVAAAINGSATAAALVKATVEDSGGTMAAVTKTYLYSGSGEILVAKIDGAVATVTAQSDTEIDLSVTAAALAAAGAAAGDVAGVQVQLNFALLTAYVPVIA